jgi:hypothetical protein
MKTNYSLLFLNSLLIILFFTGCTKDKQINSNYPSCFKPLTGRPSIDASSCGNTVMVNISNTQLIAIVINDVNLDLTTSCKTFDIANYSNDISVSYYTYNHHPDSTYFDFCDDVLYPPSHYGNKTKWSATGGSITLAVSKERKNRRVCEELYKMCISLDNIKFIKQNTVQDTVVPSLIIKDVTCGICIP